MPERQNDPSLSKVTEVEPRKLLCFEQRSKDLERAEFEITFKSTATGSRFTVRRYGFGEGEEAEVFSESNCPGYSHGFMDLVFYLETGVAPRRHFQGCAPSCTGMLYRERDRGIEVLKTNPGSFGEQAGLDRGDRLLTIGATPIYTRNDIWALVTANQPGTTLAVKFVRDGVKMTGEGALSDLSIAQWGEWVSAPRFTGFRRDSSIIPAHMHNKVLQRANLRCVAGCRRAEL